MLKINPKYYLLILFCVIYSNLSAWDNKKSEKPDECKNYVIIQGSSNINHFEFINDNPNIVNSEGSETATLLSHNIRIPVYDFSGPNKHMLNDFYQMLNATQYPYIKIQIDAYDSDEESANQLLKTQITIAGKTHNYIVPCKIVYCEKEGITLKGNLEVQLSSFNIDPPKKMLGAVKVDNEVFITFSFNYL